MEFVPVLSSFIFLVGVLNIKVHASVLVPGTKIRLLGGVESNGMGQTKNSLSLGELLLVKGIRRAKRYDKNAWKSWKPGDSDPWADTQADYERQYNRDRAENRRRQEADRRYEAEKAKSDAYLNEVANRRKNRTFTGPIIGISCLVGVIVCCCCCCVVLKCCIDKSNNSYTPYTANANSTQRRDEASTSVTVRDGYCSPPHSTVPFLSKNQPSGPQSEEIDPELPPSYAQATAD